LNRVGNNRQTLLFSATIPEELSNFAKVNFYYFKVGLKDYIFVRLDNEYTLSENI
jgi:superfamily II DNA/RNA helicase